MKDVPIHIKFDNHQNPKAAFDIVQIEELFQRKDLDHSIDQLHLVEFYILLFIREGKGLHTIDFTNYDCEKGTVLTVRKDQIHKFIRSNMKGFLLLFTNEFLVSYLEKLEAQKTLQLFNELLGVPKVQLSPKEFQEVLKLIEEINEEYFTTNDGYSLGIIRSQLHILITKLYRIKSRQKQVRFHRKYLAEFVDFQKLVEDHVTQYSKVIKYAQMMGISTKTLNTITRTIVNKSAKEFIDEIYAKQIKRLLINTEYSIKEVAYRLGFEETTNFYKYFKRQTRMTPEQFREVHKSSSLQNRKNL